MLSNRSIKGLTAYPQGSLRELCQISFPLMISLMSSSVMLFLDRLLLAHDSLDALNAAAHAGSLVQFLQFWSIATVSIAEVFVGRYNGAGRQEKLGQPVWQMIWLSLATTAIYVPLGLFMGPYVFSNEIYQQLEIEYFRLLTCFIPLTALSSAIAAFYIGQGKVKFVTGVMLIANLLNVALAVALIFGVRSWIAPMGILGAALATVGAQTFQAVWLFGAFLRVRNRQLFGTGRWHVNRHLLRRCISIGLPTAVAHSLEILAWVLIFDLMSRLGPEHMTVVTISQSILLLFTFMTEGLSKGATAIASNFIGAQQHSLVWNLLASGVKFYVGVFLLLGSVLVWHPDPLISWFLSEAHLLVDATYETLRSACFWVWIFFLFDGVSWLLIGLLTAAGDTRFVMKVGGTAPLIFALLPTYILVFRGGAPAHLTWVLITLYAVASGLIYLWRFSGEKWKGVALG